MGACHHALMREYKQKDGNYDMSSLPEVVRNALSFTKSHMIQSMAGSLSADAIEQLTIDWQKLR
jgi:hypothetical protein